MGANRSSRRRTALGAVALLVFRLRNTAGQIFYSGMRWRLLIRAMYNNRISTAENEKNKGFCNSNAIALLRYAVRLVSRSGSCGADATWGHHVQNNGAGANFLGD